MGNAGRRPLPISKAWVQVVILVILSGFFVLGLLAYRTYMERPPVPGAPSTSGAACSSPARTSPRAGRSSCTTGSWSTGRCSGTARTSARTSRPTTCDARRTSSGASTAAPARAPLPAGPSPTSAPTLRRADRHDDGEPRAGRGVRHARALLQPLLLEPRPEERPAPEGHHEPDAAAPAHGVPRVDRMGGLDRPARARLCGRRSSPRGSSRRR